MGDNEVQAVAAQPVQATEIQATEAQPADGAGAAQTRPAPDSPWAGFMMPLLLIAIFYFMFLRPQQRKEKERRRMIDELKAGATVIFAGGIIGKIAEASEKDFVIETEDGSKMRVLRSAVQSLVPETAAK